MDNGDAFVRPLAEVESPMTRDQWITRFSRIRLRSMEVAAPVAGSVPLDSQWSIVRIGSFWHRDEEYHVYAMESIVRQTIDGKGVDPSASFIVVTPIWVFVRKGSKIAIATGKELLGLAERNFSRLLHQMAKKRSDHG